MGPTLLPFVYLSLPFTSCVLTIRLKVSLTMLPSVVSSVLCLTTLLPEIMSVVFLLVFDLWSWWWLCWWSWWWRLFRRWRFSRLLDPAPDASVIPARRYDSFMLACSSLATALSSRWSNSCVCVSSMVSTTMCGSSCSIMRPSSRTMHLWTRLSVFLVVFTSTCNSQPERSSAMQMIGFDHLVFLLN